MLSCLSLLRPLLILAPHLTTKWDGYDCLSECLPFYHVCFFFGFYKGDHVIFSVKSGLAGQQAAVCQRNSSIQADGGEVQMDYHTVTHVLLKHTYVAYLFTGITVTSTALHLAVTRR